MSSIDMNRHLNNFIFSRIFCIRIGSPGRGLVGHFEFDDSAVFGQLGLEDTGLVVRFAVDGQTGYVNVLRTVVRRADDQT